MNTHNLPSPFIVKLEKSDTKYGSIFLLLSTIGVALGQDTGKIDITNRIHVISSLALDTCGLMGKRHTHTRIGRTDEGITGNQQTDTLCEYIHNREVHSVLPTFRQGNLERRNFCLYVYSLTILFFKRFVARRVYAVCTSINYKIVPVTNLNKYLHYVTRGTK